MKEQLSVKKAAIINAIGKYSKVAMSLVVNAILARILGPEDYGIVAVITVFSTFFVTFSDMGFGVAIIQNKGLSSEDIDNIYSFTVYISLGLMFVFAAFSYAIAYFYDNDVYIVLGKLLSISLLFNALNMVPNGILNRDKQFVSIAIRTIVVYISSAIVTIIMALMGCGYYSLVVQSILTALFQFMWNYFTTRPGFRIKFEFNSIKKILNYSGYQFAFNLVNYFSRNLDNLLTGKLLGSEKLGYYNTAYNLMLYPVNNLAGVVSPVLHPILADYQSQLDVIYKKYVKIVKLLADIGLFVAPVCFLAADEIITILYGDKWLLSIECFRILSIAIVAQMINSCVGGIFQAIGNTKLLFINSCINTLVTVVAILVGVLVGKDIKYLSLLVAIAYIFHFITAFYMLIRLGFRYRIIVCAKEFLAQIIILFIVYMGIMCFPFSVNNIILSAIIKSVWTGLFWGSGLLITKEYKMLLSYLKR